MNKNNYLRYFKKQNSPTQKIYGVIQKQTQKQQNIQIKLNKENQQTYPVPLLNKNIKGRKHMNKYRMEQIQFNKPKTSNLSRNKVQKQRHQQFRYNKQKSITREESHNQTLSKQNHHYYDLSKILPHITEEYDYKITNAKLKQKISSPRRDKLIMMSFYNNKNENSLKRANSNKTMFNIKMKSRQNDWNKYNNIVVNRTVGNSIYYNTNNNNTTTNDLHQDIRSKQFQSRILQKKSTSSSFHQNSSFKHSYAPVYDRLKTANNKKFYTKNLHTTFGDLNSSCRNYNDKYAINLQNQRMGLRIMNTKSRIGEYLNSSYFTCILYNGKKINKKNNQKRQNQEQKQIKKKNQRKIKNIYQIFMKKNSIYKIDNLQQNKSQRSDQFNNQANNRKQFYSNSRKQHINFNRTANIKSIDHKSDHNSSFGKIKNKQKQEKFYNTAQNWDGRNIPGRLTHEAKVMKNFQQSQRGLMQISQSYNEVDSFKKYKAYSGIRLNTEQPKMRQQQLYSSVIRQNQQQIYGFFNGNTILNIQNFNIYGLYELQQNDKLIFQLIQQNRRKLIKKKKKYFLNKIDHNNQSVNEKNKMQTQVLQYGYIKQNGVKFMINMKKHKQIEIKIKQVINHNKKQQEILDLGSFRINLKVWRNRHQSNQIKNINQKQLTQQQRIELQSVQLFIEQKQNKQNINNHYYEWRQILSYESEQPLQKSTNMIKSINLNKKKQKKQQHEKIQQNIVQFSCLIYNKDFIKYKNKLTHGQKSKKKQCPEKLQEEESQQFQNQQKDSQNYSEQQNKNQDCQQQQDEEITQNQQIQIKKDNIQINKQQQQIQQKQKEQLTQLQQKEYSQQINQIELQQLV